MDSHFISTENSWILDYQGTFGFSVLLYMKKNNDFFFSKHQSYYPPNIKRSKENSYLPANLVEDNKFSRTYKPSQLVQKTIVEK